MTLHPLSQTCPESNFHLPKFQNVLSTSLEVDLSLLSLTRALTVCHSSFNVYKHSLSQPHNSQLDSSVCFYPRSAKPLFPGAFVQICDFHSINKLSKSVPKTLSLFLPELSKASVSRLPQLPLTPSSAPFYLQYS